MILMCKKKYLDKEECILILALINKTLHVELVQKNKNSLFHKGLF